MFLVLSHSNRPNEILSFLDFPFHVVFETLTILFKVDWMVPRRRLSTKCGADSFDWWSRSYHWERVPSCL